MKSHLEHDYTEVIEFSGDRMSAADRSLIEGASLALCAGRDGSIAFTMHGREWLGNAWGDRKCVKLELEPCTHIAVQDLAAFFERCAAHLRQYRTR